jgi:alpha-beta hydrolase superfamily lysophospholipase
VERLHAGRRACGVLLILVIAATGGSCRSSQTAWTESDGGATRWIDVPAGRLKTRVYTGTRVSESPVLVLVLHGDLPDPPPSYHYEFAKVVADTLASSSGTGIVAAGVLRPGYADPTGERSSGDMGRAITDNYTPEVVDAVELAARELAAAHHPRAVVLVGHSGGGAIVASLLGRHPDTAEAAVLAGCGCDPAAWRSRRLAATGNSMFAGPTRSLQPLALVDRVAPGTLVRLVVGDQDDVTPPADSQAYATALRARGVDASVNVAPGLGHNILFAPAVRDALRDVLTRLGKATPR